MSQYKTRRQQRRTRRRNTTRTIFVLMLLLALSLGGLYLYKWIEHRKTSLPIAAVNKPKAFNTEAPKDSLKTTVQTAAKPLVAPGAKAAEPGKPPGKKTISDTASLTAATATQELAKAPKLKQLTQQQMEEILTNIQQEKTRMNSFSNCIQVRKTSNSNVENVFKMAGFLKAKGFIISGRLTVEKDQEGVTIDASGSCITLTIGSM